MTLFANRLFSDTRFRRFLLFDDGIDVWLVASLAAHHVASTLQEKLRHLFSEPRRQIARIVRAMDLSPGFFAAFDKPVQVCGIDHPSRIHRLSLLEGDE